jgi:hypothetical protein
LSRGTRAGKEPHVLSTEQLETKWSQINPTPIFFIIILLTMLAQSPCELPHCPTLRQMIAVLELMDKGRLIKKKKEG